MSGEALFFFYTAVVLLRCHTLFIKDGHGVDWPIRYKDIAHWYDHVESFIGVSGQAEGIPQLPDGIFQPPFEMNIVEKYFKKKLKPRTPIVK